MRFFVVVVVVADFSWTTLTSHRNFHTQSRLNMTQLLVPYQNLNNYVWKKLGGWACGSDKHLLFKSDIIYCRAYLQVSYYAILTNFFVNFLQTMILDFDIKFNIIEHRTFKQNAILYYMPLTLTYYAALRWSHCHELHKLCVWPWYGADWRSLGLIHFNMWCVSNI